MPVRAPKRHHKSAPKHKHTQHYLQTYWPYLPMAFIVALGLIFGGSRPLVDSTGVLSYAAEMSSGALLSETNAERNASGKSSLTINSKLTSAAQAKADDMVTRNYWSHETPDGQQPWVFVQNAGYSYKKAGENLAYGFATSKETVIGWMNSATHKANLLDAAFSEVGFGITNGSNFNNSGPQTVVVAMYGQPQVLATSNTAPPSSSPAPTATKKTTPVVKPTETVAATPAPAEVTAKEEKPPVVEQTETEIARAQIITKGKTPWVVSAIAVICAVSVVILLVRHTLGLHKLLKRSERFILRHPLLDMLLVVLIMLGYVLTTTSGFVK